ncbi:MAG: phosphocholine cytidylyltransferase family protein [Polyangiaceae bacterium]|nr:phosphocholine cytidylyltransferase family protein [Polyangiaceae bacterium]
MHAILLAAGRGRRLETPEPKCLVQVGGRTLLDRHLDNMPKAGIDRLTLVVGYEQQRIRDHLAKRAPSLPIEIIENPRYERGSIVSLHCASHLIGDGALWMDADVLYPAELLARLVASKHDNCVLLDRRSEETGEEMMLGVRDGRVHRIARKVLHEGPWDVVGEAVGFAKVGGEGARIMRSILDEEVAAERLDQEYEAAMNTAFGRIRWGFEPIDEFAWTEIDFREDVEKAERILATSA